jgi:myo-inositol-1(or 4)-monophosphatase
VTADLAALLELAQSVAGAAGRLIRERRDAVERMAVAATKSTPTDVVTESDTAAEALIRAQLLAARPGDGFLGEEGGSLAGRSGVVWVVDPIDGTVNYLYGLPAYAVSVAAQVDGASVAGVVHVPATGETWTATRGGGSRLDGDALAVTRCDDLAMALVATGFGYAAERRAAQAAVVARLLPRVRDVRRMGAASIDLCSVATGRLDGYYEQGLAAWDRAAGGLVAAEAGARVGGLGDAPASERMTVAAGPRLWNQLQAVLAELGA